MKQSRDIYEEGPAQFLQQNQLLHSTSKRAVYQGGHCWGKMLEHNMCMPLAAENWGWMDQHEWEP